MKIYIFGTARQLITTTSGLPVSTTRHHRIVYKQAAIIAEKLKTKFWNAYQTSPSVPKTLWKRCPISRLPRNYWDDRMIERNYGQLNGVTHEEFIAKKGEENSTWFIALFEVPPDGESFAMVETRVHPVYWQPVGKNAPRKQNAVISLTAIPSGYSQNYGKRPLKKPSLRFSW